MVALETWAGVWGTVMLTIAWQAALLALLVVGCEQALRIRAAQVRHRLWWIVLAAPLLLAPARLALERREATVAVPAPAPVVQAVWFTHSLLWPAGAPLPAAETVSPTLPLPPPAPTRALPLSWPALLLAAWLLGCAVVAGRLLLGHRSLRKLLVESQPVSDGRARELLEELCREAGVRREIALRSTTDLSAPLLYGLGRPTILMPGEWLDSLSPEDLRVVLAHEVAHIQRRDVLGNLLQRLAELPLFFHPAAWLAGRRITMAREELCDAVALGDTADPRSYALSLLSVAEKTRGRLALASVGVAEGRFTLLKRVEAIMAQDRRKRFSRMAGVVLGIFVLAAAVGSAAVELRSGTAVEDGQQVAAGTELEGEELAEAQQVLNNMKNIALALQMFLVDHEFVLPNTTDTEELMELLGPYVKDQSVFLRPGTTEPVVRFTFEPGANARSVADPATSVLAVVDYHPEWRVEAYVDGHVQRLGKHTPTAGASLTPWPEDVRGAGLMLLLNLAPYGAPELRPGASWVYSAGGETWTLRLASVAPAPNGDGALVVAEVSSQGVTEVLHMRLSNDRKSLFAGASGYSGSASARELETIFPELKPGARWQSPGMAVGSVSSVTSLPLSIPAGEFTETTRASVSFGAMGGAAFWFAPGAGLALVEAQGEKVFELVEYRPGGSAPQASASPRDGLEAGHFLVLPLLNLWRYGPDPLVAGTSWTYDMMGQPLGLRIVEAEPNGDATATVLTVDLSHRSQTQRARVVLPRDRRSLSVSTGAEDSFRTFDLTIPPLVPGAKWKPLGEEQGTITSTERSPLTTPAGYFAGAAKVSVSFGEPLGDAAFWFAPGVGLVAVEETRGRHTSKALELIEYRPAETGFEGAAAQDLPPGLGPEGLRGIAGALLLNLSPYGNGELRPGYWTYNLPGGREQGRLHVSSVSHGADGYVASADITLFGTTKQIEVTLSPDRRLFVARPTPPLRGPTMTLTMPELRPGDLWRFVGLDELPVRAVESRPVSTPAGQFPDAVRLAFGSTKEDAVFWFVPGVGLVAVDQLGRRVLDLTSSHSLAQDVW